jgi:hypothetical protein
MAFELGMNPTKFGGIAGINRFRMKVGPVSAAVRYDWHIGAAIGN